MAKFIPLHLSGSEDQVFINPELVTKISLCMVGKIDVRTLDGEVATVNGNLEAVVAHLEATP